MGRIGSIGAMSRSRLSEALVALVSRLKAAAIGFGITVAPLAVAALIQYALVYALVPGSLILHAIATTLFAIYWLLTALLGKGQLLRLRAANKILTLSVLAFLALSLHGTFFPTLEDYGGGFKDICPIIGISDEAPPRYTLDGQTNCEAFAYSAHTIAIFGLMGSSFLLLVISLIVRIVSSRRESWSDEYRFARFERAEGMGPR